MDISAVQLCAQTFFHIAILFIDTSNNASHNLSHWLIGTPYLSTIANNVGSSMIMNRKSWGLYEVKFLPRIIMFSAIFLSLVWKLTVLFWLKIWNFNFRERRKCTFCYQISLPSISFWNGEAHNQMGKWFQFSTAVEKQCFSRMWAIFRKKLSKYSNDQSPFMNMKEWIVTSVAY